MIALLRHEVLSRRGAMLGWGAGLVVFVLIYMGFYPSIAEQFGDLDLSQIAAYQAFGGFDMSTFAGYFTSAVLSFLPLLLAIYAIITSTGTLAGEEERGTLEIILAQPHPRWQVVAAKAVGIALAALVILSIASLGVLVTYWAIQGSVEQEVAAGNLVLATLSTWPLVVALMMIGLFLGAFLPSRRLAAVVTTAVLVIGYFGSNLAPLVEPLRRVEWLFLFHYFDRSPAVVNGQIDGGNILVLAGLAVLFFFLALGAFQARDVGVGAWPWQRARL